MDLLEQPIVQRPMTPEHVLAIFRDQWAYCVDEDGTSLQSETSVAEWVDGMDLSMWRLGEHLSRFFKIQANDGEWNEVLYPPKERTVGDVCRLISRYAWVPAIEPVDANHGAAGLSPGQDDNALRWAAGAFLLVRRQLAEHGIDVSSVTPETELVPYLSQDEDVLYELCKIAPGRLPLAFEHRYLPTRLYSWSRWIVRGAFLKCLVAGLLTGGGIAAEFDCPVTAIFLVICLAGVVGLILAPRRLYLGDLVTFGDLAWAMVTPNESNSRIVDSPKTVAMATA